MKKSIAILLSTVLLMILSIISAYGCEGFAECKEKATQGNAESQVQLSKIYAQGIGVEKNYKEGLKWLRKAADKGNASAYYYLHQVYANGYGVIKDKDESQRLLQKAADLGDISAQRSLGQDYEFYNKDFKNALKWMKKAAEQGDIRSQNWVARLYYRGEAGVFQDYRKAAKWFRILAEQSSIDGDDMHSFYKSGLIAEGQYILAKMYGKGDGVIQDYLMAHMFSNIAYSNASFLTKAREYRDEIAEKLTQEQIMMAQNMAREWMESH